MPRDPLNVLGLRPGTSLKEARSSFKALSLKLHPDKNKDGRAAEAFRTVETAYRAIEKNPTLLSAEEDVYRPGENLTIKVTVASEELFFCKEKDLSIIKLITCLTCDGTGSADKVLYPCDLCEGTGTITNKYVDILNQDTVCQGCMGVGVAPTSKCGVCEGKTVLKRTVTEKVPVNQNVIAGMSACLRGRGNAGRCAGRSGDLYIKFIKKPSGYFILDDKIYTEVKISPVQYLIGDDLTLSILGEYLPYQLPAKTKKMALDYKDKKVHVLFKMCDPVITDGMRLLYKQILALEKP